MPTSETVSSPNGESRTQSIVQAAYNLIVEKGFEGFRIRDVAERAGIHHATLLHYFPTKEALIQGVVGGMVSRLDQVLVTGPGALPARAALHTHFAHVLAQMRDVPEQFAVFNELFLRANRDSTLREVLRTTDENWHGLLVSLLERGVAEGAFRRDLDPQAAATVVMCTFKGFAFDLTLTAQRSQQTVAQLERWITGEDA